MGRAFEDSGPSQDTENAAMYVVVNSFRSHGWQVGAVGEGVEVGLEALPRHLFPGRDFICPPCDHFTASMMSVSSPEGGDISSL